MVGKSALCDHRRNLLVPTVDTTPVADMVVAARDEVMTTAMVLQEGREEERDHH